MNHFTLGDWVDFIRNLKSGAVNTEMQGHLDGGCQQCLKVVHMWRTLVGFAATERSCCPPEPALRSVRGLCGLFKPGRHGTNVPVMARLLFDSHLKPVPVGIRSSHSAPRQLVYSVGRLFIDLRIDCQPGRVCVVGQAQQHPPSDASLAGKEVLILQGTKTVGRTTLNRFGEFQFTLKSEGNSEFSIVLKGPKTLVIPVRNLGLAQEELSDL
jgi:hypothetical protein